MMRSYATVASKFSSRLERRGKKPPLSLDHFIQRGRALALWREILRTTMHIPDKGTRNDMRQHARIEFERHKNITDLDHIRYLISHGKTEFDMTKSSLINAGILTS